MREPIKEHQALVAEQKETQLGRHGKCRVRRLSEYGSYIFSNGAVVTKTTDGRRFPYPSPREEEHLSILRDEFAIQLRERTYTVDRRKHVQTLLGLKGHGIGNIIDALKARFPGERLKWVDACCGHAMAMREFKLQFPNEPVDIAGIDLLSPKCDPLETQFERARQAGQAKLADEYEAVYRVPCPIQYADATKVGFGPAHLITAIEAIQYIEDKLGAIAHWYNQLALGGVLIVSNETGWTHWVRIDTGETIQIRPKTNQLIDQLLQGHRYIADYGEDYQKSSEEIRTLILFRTEREMRSTPRLISLRSNPDGYKASYYKKN